MANVTKQISAYISEETKSRLEHYSKTTGTKKSFLIENALKHHLKALYELPSDVLIPAQIEVDEQNLSTIYKRLENPNEPTQAMKDLFAEKPK